MPRLLFTASDDLLSLGIRLFTRSPTAHVAIALGPWGEQLLHVRARKGVTLEPRAKFRHRAIGEFEILPDVSLGLGYCLQQVGKPYDYDEVAARPLLTALRTVMPLAPVDNRTRDAWNCVRFVLGLDPTGTILPEWRDLDPLTVTPGQLFEACAQGLNFVRIR